MHTKLRLNLDQLAVDSFDTAATRTGKGTIFGEQCTCWTNCTCPGCPTCDHTACGQNSCQGTCDASCNGTCGATCHTCGWTCDCPGPGTCYDTACGNSPCCI